MENEEKKISQEPLYPNMDQEHKEEDLKKQKEDNKKKNIRYILYLLVIIIITGIVLWASLWGKSAEIFNLFQGMNWTYFICLCGAIILGFVINAFIIYLFVKLYYKHYKFHQALANNSVGVFYNGITPGSSGGQVAQIYTFNKQGVSISSAASVMVMSYIVYQTCLIVMGIISVATHIGDVLSIQTIDLVINDQTIPVPIVIFVIFGFALNLLVIAILIFMSYSTRFHNFISVSLINFLARIHLVKKPDEMREKVRTQVENFRIEFRRLQSNIPFTILVFTLTFVSLWITESLPLLCGLSLNGFTEIKSFGEFMDKLFLSIVYTNFHQMITGLIPIPGSSGVSEFVFLRLFTNYFNAEGFVEKGGINAVMLLWRFMSFHIPFLINGVVAGTYKSRGIPQDERFIQSDRKTFVNIQNETYEERKKTSEIAYQTHVFEREELLDKLKNIKDDKKSLKNNPKDSNNTNEDGEKK